MDRYEFRFKDMSTHKSHLHQNGILTWFCNEMAIIMSIMMDSSSDAGQTDGCTDRKIMFLHTLTMRGSHVASFVKFRPVV